MGSAAFTAAETKPLSQTERVVDTFIAPTKTFTDIRRSSSWWLPWLLGAIVGLGLVYLADTKIGMEKISENRLALTPKQAAKLDQLNPEQRAAQMQIAAKFTRVLAYGFPVMHLLIVAVIAGVLMATFKFGFGAELQFKQCFAISIYAFLPAILKGLLIIMTIFITGGAGFTFENPLASNLGALVDQSSAGLFSLASSIDVFNIWTVILTGIGYSCVTQLKRGTCMGVVFGWWAFNTLLWAGVAAAFN